ncbi:unnamed protein product [Urochloa decumbens]|uniref:Uncharacterized protein n=1 Tax=Urochloa decumbens TaxID=240449 RepID=A0ABC9FQM8_9POAL
MAAEMVVGAIVSDGVSRGIHYLLGKRKERAPEGHNMERLEMAVTTLGLALERSAILPITDIWLLHRRKMLKRAYDEAMDLLHRHKRQPLQQDHDQETGVTLSFPQRWIARARKSTILLYRLGVFVEVESRLSCSDVARFERFVDSAEKFVKDVEYGISLWQHHTFRYPLERQLLLQGKTLRYTWVKGRKSRFICICPIFTEGRGVEVSLSYIYEHRKMPATFFDLDLQLRMSACSNIIGTAISCLEYLASQFKIATKLGLGEIHLLSSLQDSLSHSNTPSRWRQQAIAHNTEIFFRPDPICCTNNVISSSASSLGVPESVIYFDFGYYVSAVEYILPSSTDEIVSMNSPPLYLEVILEPHFSWFQKQEIILEFDQGQREHIDGSIHHLDALLRSKAIEYVVRRPAHVEAECHLYWNSPHGYVFRTVPTHSFHIN